MASFMASISAHGVAFASNSAICARYRSCTLA
jgi:hypothetical protein